MNTPRAKLLSPYLVRSVLVATSPSPHKLGLNCWALVQGIGPQRNITLEHGVSLVLTYITITSYPHYAVEMTVQPSDHTVLDGSGTIHGFPIPDEPLHAYDGVYLMAIDQGFRVRVRAGTTRYFTVPEQPH